MNVWRSLKRGLDALLHPARADQDEDDEVAHFLQQAAAEHAARGLTPGAAMRAARLEVGPPMLVREEIRGFGWENLVRTVYADLRHAVRSLRREPLFALVTITVLAVGLGMSTTIVSAIKPVLFDALPYSHPDQVVTIWEAGKDEARSLGTWAMDRELADRSRSFDAIAAFKPWQSTLTGEGRPERLEGQRVGADFFRVIGVAPALGRAFTTADDRLNGPDVVVISDALWRSRFGADAGIVGRSIMLDGRAYQVIGVMPPGFDNVLAPSAVAWAPLQYDLSQGRAWGHHLRTVGRLRPDVSPDQASADLNRIGKMVLQEFHPDTYGDAVHFTVTPLQEELTQGIRPALVAIVAAVVLVLLIACANAASLLLARNARRRGEFALRAALGASRGRLFRQSLTESLVLSLLGGAGGMVVALIGVGVVVAWSPTDLPRAGAIGVNGTVLAIGLVFAIAVGVVTGILPALSASRSDPQQAMQQSLRRIASPHRGARSALVISETALAIVLLVSAGLLWRSLDRLFSIQPGFEPSHLLTMEIQASGVHDADAQATHNYFGEVLGAVRAVPGVTSASLTSQLPLSGRVDLYGVHFDPAPPDDPGEPTGTHGTFRYAVSPGYLETMQIPLQSGRRFSPADRAGSARVVVISESLARRRLQGLDPIGQRLRIGPSEPYTIIGVAADVRQLSLTQDDADAVYITSDQWLFTDNVMSLVIRTSGDPDALVASVRQAIWSVDRNQPVDHIATMDHLVEATAAERQFALRIFGVFSITALMLAAAGLYGVLSGSVTERTREIGVRSALGASRGGIIRLILQEGLTLTVMGGLIGIVGAVAITGVLRALLFGLSPLDPLTYLFVFTLLLAVALPACGVPAWRAARVDPVRALRQE